MGFRVLLTGKIRLPRTGGGEIVKIPTFTLGPQPGRTLGTADADFPTLACKKGYSGFWTLRSQV